MNTISVEKQLEVTVEIDGGVLLGGVEDSFNDMLADDVSVEDALNQIAYDAVLRYILMEKFPNYTSTEEMDCGDGRYVVRMKKIEY